MSFYGPKPRWMWLPNLSVIYPSGRRKGEFPPNISFIGHFLFFTNLLPLLVFFNNRFYYQHKAKLIFLLNCDFSFERHTTFAVSKNEFPGTRHQNKKLNLSLSKNESSQRWMKALSAYKTHMHSFLPFVPHWDGTPLQAKYKSQFWLQFSKYVNEKEITVDIFTLVFPVAHWKFSALVKRVLQSLFYRPRWAIKCS